MSILCILDVYGGAFMFVADTGSLGVRYIYNNY